MESKFWFYAYVTLGGAVLFAGGYYLGLSGKADTKIEFQKFVSDEKKKESKKELRKAELKEMSSPASSKMAFGARRGRACADGERGEGLEG